MEKRDRKTLDEIAQERSDEGGKKYQVPNPDPSGPWGSGPTAELFWFKDLAQDAEEELVDATVYLDKLQIRLDAEHLEESYRKGIELYIGEVRFSVQQAFYANRLLRDLLLERTPDLTRDRTEFWGKFNRAIG